MDVIISVLHVVGAVFLVGPMAILPMTAMRAIRSGQGKQVQVLAKSTVIFSGLSLLVVVFGFGAMSMAPSQYELSITTPWILWSLVLYAIALVLNLFVVVPSMRNAAESLITAETLNASASTAAVDGAAVKERTSYPAIAAGSGVASLLLVAVTVLMVWKP